MFQLRIIHYMTQLTRSLFVNRTPRKYRQYSFKGLQLTLWRPLLPSPVSTGWRSRSVFSLSWRQLFIVHWTVRLLATWL